MHFFHAVHKVEVLGNGSLAFGFGVLDHLGVHLGELVGFTFNGGLEVSRGVADLAGITQVSVGVDGFGGGSGAEKLGHLGQAFLVGHLGEGKVFTVGLGFTGKGRHEIFLSLVHLLLLLCKAAAFYYQEQFLFKQSHAYCKAFFPVTPSFHTLLSQYIIFFRMLLHTAAAMPV